MKWRANTDVDIRTGNQTLEVTDQHRKDRDGGEHTAALRDAYSTGTRRLKTASGGGFIHSLATASSSYEQ